jgi:UDP-2-acetamido-2,6-beta-L-arabino-hexul-4-ose reductase
MNILVTGSKGFIAKNLIIRLKQIPSIKILYYNKKKKNLQKLIQKSDIIYHFAGQNRSAHKSDFVKNNVLLTKYVCDVISQKKLETKLIFSSSTQVKNNSIYGKTKLQCENIIKNTLKQKQYLIFRMPNVFGKWSKPHYNSVVSTFCYQVPRNQKIKLIDPYKKIQFVYIDDLIDFFIKVINLKSLSNYFYNKKKIYTSTPLKIYNLIKYFYNNDNKGKVSNLSNPFHKKLYSTYLTFLPFDKISFDPEINLDKRGFFIEFLKLGHYGQISAISILPGQFRGGHYHNTKTEKFMLINGRVKFNFVNLNNNKKYSLIMSEKKNRIILTVPGWAHEIVNNSKKKIANLIIWANEEFSKKRSDTIRYNF